jgi:predicted nuclease of predicted toxin-antitoxin system
MNFVADEGVDRQIVERLRADGHSVLYVAEMAPGIPDDVVLTRANQELALLLTADKDFGEMVYRQSRLANGVILVRLAGLSSIQKAQIVASAIADHIQEMSKAFTVIEPGRVRVRRSFLR